MEDTLEKVAIESAIATRKIRDIRLFQKGGIHHLRPQQHIFYVDGPGTGKSTLWKGIQEAVVNPASSLKWIESVTEAGFKGTISKSGIYTPGTVAKVGGKLAFIDEFNMIKYSELMGFLSILENQRFSKSIAYGVQGLVPPIDNDYLSVTVEDGEICGNVIFSCVACAMEIPDQGTFNNVVSTKVIQNAVLQRFLVICKESNIHDAHDTIRGKNKPMFNDYAGKAQTIDIPKEVYGVYVKDYFKAVRNIPGLDAGFVTRANGQLIRLGATKALADAKHEVDLIIKDKDYLTDAIKWLPAIARNYRDRGEYSKKAQYEDLLKETPNMSKEWYAIQLGVHRNTIRNYEKEGLIANELQY